jgi:hypothetical protein
VFPTPAGWSSWWKGRTPQYVERSEQDGRVVFRWLLPRVVVGKRPAFEILWYRSGEMVTRFVEDLQT